MRSGCFVVVGAALSACTATPTPSAEPVPVAIAVAEPAPRASADSLHHHPPTATSAPSAWVAACPPDMVLVEGLFCPAADERCEQHDPEYDENPERSERCRRFAEPSRCVSEKRRLVRYCVDRYEWPNEKGKLPQVLVDFSDAARACSSVGKRLCDEDEWLFACEGEAMLPYTNGYDRDATACVMDRPYVERPRRLERWDACMGSGECRSDFEKVDQREPSGAFERCVSPFGAYDMNGNVNEWVNVPGEKYPHRSGLKGGWWGPVRDRCRPTVHFHDESDWGYEIGFRCCEDARP